MRLLNVRLDPEDAARVKALRARGIRVSTLVRSAIRAAYEREGARGPADVQRILDEVYAQHPSPPKAALARPDTRDRRKVQRYVRSRLRQRRP
jgi:hypothetical protein